MKKKCEHDWADVGNTVWYDNFDKFKIPGVRGKIDSNCMPGLINWFECNYRGYKISLHPKDKDLYGNATNSVCLKCEETISADEKTAKKIKEVLEKEYQILKARKTRKKTAEAIWKNNRNADKN